jgi:hypothetical protein
MSRETYQRRRDELAAAEQREQSRSLRLSVARGAAFLAFLAGMVATVARARAGGLPAQGGGARAALEGDAADQPGGARPHRAALG